MDFDEDHVCSDLGERDILSDFELAVFVLDDCGLSRWEMGTEAARTI